MPTECRQDSFDFGTVDGRRVVGAFDGGLITSDAGALLLGATNKAIRLVERFAACFQDGRDGEQIEHTVATLVGQRVFGLALGYEDLNDHDQLRHDPVFAVLAGKLEARRKRCAPVAGKSTLNRLEHAPEEGPGYTSSRYHKISHDAGSIERLFVTLFQEAHATPPQRIILDLDATDDPLHGHQEGRFFHGYYDCYCYLPLYVFCGRHLLAAKLRRSNIDASAGATEETARIVAQIRERWPQVQIVLRADSGFAREALMAWCEDNGVDYVFGLARNERLVAAQSRRAGGGRDQGSGTSLQGLHVEHAGQLEPQTPRDRQGRMDTRRSQSALHRHLARRDAGFRAVPLRRRLLRARRHGKPHQGMPTRSLCRPHAGNHHARQPAAPVVRVFGLCARVRAAPHRPCRNPAGGGDVRDHPPQAAQDRSASDHERTPRQVRVGLGLPAPGHLRRRLHPAPTSCGLRPPDPSARQQNRKNPSHVQSAAAATTVLVWRLAGVISPCQ